MPAIILQRDDAAAAEGAGQPAVFTPNSTLPPPVQPWIIAVIVVGLVLVVAVAVFFVARYLRRKQNRKAKEKNPIIITHKDFSRRRKMSELDRLEEEELQRSVMIRKSLASRISSKRASQTESASDLSVDEDDDQSGGLREDWKEWEARVQRDRSNSADRHPAEDLPIPSQSRPRSPSRSPLLGAQPTPTLPSTPTFGPALTPPLSRASERSRPSGLPAAHLQ